MSRVDTSTVRAGEYPLTIRVRSHTFAADEGTEGGGQDTAPSAHDYFDSALASCKALTALWYAKRHGIPLERVEAHVESDSSQERAGVYRMRVRVELIGPLTEEQRAQVQRAIAKCPVHKLMTTAEIQIETAPDEAPR